MDIEEKTAEILSALFEHKINVGDDVTVDNEEMWDSLKHFELIATLEEEFDVKIKKNEIPKLNSMDIIINKIKELKNENTK